MKKALYIFIALMLSVFMQSCLRYHTGFRKTSAPKVESAVFPSNFQKALYKTNIHFFKKDYSGLMFFKRNKEKGEVRFVFLSEFGLKFFDFKLTDAGVFSVEYIIDELNRKSVISVLEKDFKLLFQRGIGEERIMYFDARRKGFFVQRLSRDKSRNYYFTDKTSGQLVRIESAGAIFKNTKIQLADYENNVARSIDIKHLGMNLRLRLKLVE